MLPQVHNAHISTSQIAQVEENVNTTRNGETDTHLNLMQLKLYPQYCAHGY